MKCLMEAWQQHEAAIGHWLIKQCGSRQEAEDMMQEVFLKAMRNSQRFCSLDDSKSWLFKMVKNHYIDTIRRRVELMPIDDAPLVRDEYQEEGRYEPLVQMQRCLPKILPQLDTAEREIIEQCDLNGVRQADYAFAHGLTLAAAKSRLQRARKRLKALLISQCQVEISQGRVCCFRSSDQSGAP